MNFNKKINDIIELLSDLTLIELNILTAEIRNKFQIQEFVQNKLEDVQNLSENIAEPLAAKVEKTTFDLILQAVPTEKRVPVLKAIRNATSLDLKGAKDSISDLPKTLLENLSKENATEIKKQLEDAGATVTLI